MNNNKEESPITILLWWMSGAEIEVIRRFPYEKQKYLVIGTSVLLTGIIGFLSGAYSIYKIFGSMIIGAFFGIIWGIAIINLDRYIVSSVSRTDSILKNWGLVALQMLLSSLLSFITIIPIVMRLFDQQIITYNSIQQKQEFIKHEEELESQIDLASQQELANMENIIKRKSAMAEDLLRQYEEEIAGKGIQGRPGNGRIVILKRVEYEQAMRDVRETRIRLDSLYSRLNKEKKDRINGLQANTKYYQAPDFMGKYHTFGELLVIESSVRWTFAFLQVFMLLLFSTPIAIKLLSRRNPYDTYMLQTDHIQEPLPEAFTNNEEDGGSSGLSYAIYFNKMMDGISQESRKMEKRARDFYFQGLGTSAFGILLAVGLIYFWLYYFSVSHFQNYHIYEMVSSTTIVLLIEFLGAWFLKQSKSINDKALYIIKMRSLLDRYLLSYLAIKEFSSTEAKEKYLQTLMDLLNKDLRFPADASLKGQDSFTQEAFSSIASLAETVKSLVKEK